MPRLNRGAPGGKRPGAGRPKGSKNKATVERQAVITADGITPLDYLLKVVRDEGELRPVRIDAANKAAPYVHPRLAAVEHTGKGGGPIQHEELSELEVARRVAFMLFSAAKKTDAG
jgi:hypothetical protein